MPDFKQNYFQRRTKHKGPRSNNRIVSAEVQVISSDGQNLGILIENYSGKLPFWISPLQTVVIPVSDEFDEYSKKVNKQLINAGFSSEVDLKNHNLNYKIREHSLSKVPILLICGKKEVDSNSVTIRRLDSNKQENIELKKFITIHQALNKAPSL